MKEQTKTITTQLTHDIIKKDFFALHLGFINLLRVAFCWVVVAIYLPLWLVLFAEGNILFAVLIGVPFFILAVVIVFFTVNLIRQTIGIVTKNYKIVTDTVSKRTDRYQLMLARRSFFSMRTDRLTFEEYGSFQLERHTYYKWSPMFELTDDQIFEHAQKGTPYHLVISGNTIVMIYNTENFLLEDTHEKN